ncbi:hypothetical protein [Marinobacterium sp. BA1]|uniref:hypothetical protein n=1 Tax=Marinobacterium sp. BA1 TaxID=3138931 RepID=UPI0032E6DBB5
MAEQLDITQKPLSALELLQKREALTAQIVSGERRLHVHTWMLVALAAIVFLTAIAGNAHWGWLSWGQFVAAVAGVAVGAVGAVVAAVAAAVAAAGGGVTVGVGVAVAFSVAAAFDVGGGAVAVGVAAAFGVAGGVAGIIAVVAWLSKQEDRIKQARIALAALSDADREACLEIKDWLEDDDIRQYRDWVQEEGRVFTLGEVEAMRAHWNSRAQRQAEAKRAADIDAACREVYVDNLIQS